MNILILFGVTGDLAQKKVLPAISTSITESRNTDSVFVFGVGRKKQPPTAFESIKQGIYLDGELDAPAVYKRLCARIRTLVASLARISPRPAVHINVYSSLPPHMHAIVAEHISTYVRAPLFRQKHIDVQFHFLVEKPIGVDYQSAQDTLTALSHAFGSLDSVRFVDHYLAKERVRDIRHIATQMPYLLQSTIGSPTLREIDVVLFETVDVHGRGMFYDEVGALFDVGQNHLLQVLAEVLVARYMTMVYANQQSIQGMRIPTKSDIIDHLRIVGVPQFGQYDGYIHEPGVKERSDTETYVDVTLELTNAFHKKFTPYLKGITYRIASAKKAGYNASAVFLKDARGATTTIDMREGVDAYTYLFRHVLTSPRLSPELFATAPEILSAWKCVMAIKKKKSKKRIVTYQSLPRG